MSSDSPGRDPDNPVESHPLSPYPPNNEANENLQADHIVGSQNDVSLPSESNNVEIPVISAENPPHHASVAPTISQLNDDELAGLAADDLVESDIMDLLLDLVPGNPAGNSPWNDETNEVRSTHASETDKDTAARENENLALHKDGNNDVNDSREKERKRGPYKCPECGSIKVENKDGVDIPHLCPVLVSRVEEWALKNGKTISEERMREILQRAQRKMEDDEAARKEAPLLPSSEAKQSTPAATQSNDTPSSSRGPYRCRECNVPLKGHRCPYRLKYRKETVDDNRKRAAQPCQIAENSKDNAASQPATKSFEEIAQLRAEKEGHDGKPATRPRHPMGKEVPKLATAPLQNTGNIDDDHTMDEDDLKPAARPRQESEEDDRKPAAQPLQANFKLTTEATVQPDKFSTNDDQKVAAQPHQLTAEDEIRDENPDDKLNEESREKGRPPKRFKIIASSEEQPEVFAGVAAVEWAMPTTTVEEPPSNQQSEATEEPTTTEAVELVDSNETNDEKMPLEAVMEGISSTTATQPQDKALRSRPPLGRSQQHVEKDDDIEPGPGPNQPPL